MKRKYYISFDTLDMPGVVRAIAVTVDCEIKPLETEFDVNLCSHPLYPALVMYVKANPYKGDDGDE